MLAQSVPQALVMAPMSQPLVDDCFRPDQEQLSHEVALTLLKERLAPVTSIERVRLADACGRVLAEPATASWPVPAHTNSAVDGYAFAHADHIQAEGQVWPVVGRAAAGHPFRGDMRTGEAVRIFTGAVVPAGADTVVMQEDVHEVAGAAGAVIFQKGLKKGANVRRAGEDVTAGEVLLGVGHTIRPQDLAALASIGLGEVAVYSRLKVGVVSTGDEVVPPGLRGLDPGEVFDANQAMIAALAHSAGADVECLGIWPDRAGDVRRGLERAAGMYDVILTSGGASRGEEDHIAAAIGALGQRHFWQILIKPGRPMMLGQVGRSVVVGLPGNPVAVFVCFLMYVWPMLRRIGGAPWVEPRRLMVPAAFDFTNRKVGRREFWRGRMIPAKGGWQVDKFQRDGSGLISSLRWADCLIEIPEGVGDVRRGDLVAVIPFGEFGIGAA
jgi:molybdopterin molybdotransferase